MTAPLAIANLRRIRFEAIGKCACPPGSGCSWCEIVYLAEEALAALGADVEAPE